MQLLSRRRGRAGAHCAVACRYLQGLFALAHDASTEVRKAVCTGLVQMLQLQPERLAPHMHDIIEYMLASTQVSASPAGRKVSAVTLASSQLPS